MTAAYATLMERRRRPWSSPTRPTTFPSTATRRGLGVIHHRDVRHGLGRDDASRIHLLPDCRLFTLLARYSVDGSMHYVCMDWRHLSRDPECWPSAYSELKNLCVWAKTTRGMGSLYRSQHELIFVFKSGRAPHRNNVQLGRYGRNRTNVWNYPSANAFGRSGEEGKLLALHPTVKPVALVADAIMDCTARGEVVLDAFLGSGTTVIAAERTGRRCFGLELDPVYVDTVVRRWQAYTSDVARHVTTGKIFGEIAATVGERP